MLAAELAGPSRSFRKSVSSGVSARHAFNTASESPDCPTRIRASSPLSLVRHSMRSVMDAYQWPALGALESMEILGTRATTPWVRIHTARPEPVINTIPVRLGIDIEHITAFNRS